MVFFENSYTDNSVEKTLLLNSSHKTIHQESETLKKTKQHESPLSHHQNLYLILLVPKRVQLIPAQQGIVPISWPGISLGYLEVGSCEFSWHMSGTVDVAQRCSKSS